MSLILLSLCKKQKFLDLTHTNMIIPVIDRSIKRALGMEDVPIQVDKLLIPCNFVVMDLEDSPQAPIISGKGIPPYCRGGD